MAGKSLGTQRNAPYADRVIKDITGVRSFCSTVLASGKPTVVVMNVLQGPRGNLLIRFFDEQLHQARMEMVSLLYNATTKHHSKSEYQMLLKLYKKSVKKARKLVDPKGTHEDSVTDNYPGLKALTGLGSFVDDDDPFAEDDSDYESYTDYADAYIEALRNGQEPPRPLAPGPRRGLDLDLTGNDDLLEMIQNIQKRIGRILTPAETLQLVKMAEEAEDDENTGPLMGSMDPRPQNLSMDTNALVNQIAGLVLAKLETGAAQTMAGEEGRPQAPAFQSVEDLMAFAEQHPNGVDEDENEDPPVPETVTIVPQPKITPKLPPEEPPVRPQPKPEPKQHVQVPDPSQLATEDLIQAKNRGDLSGLEVQQATEPQEDTTSEPEGPDVKSGPESDPQPESPEAELFRTATEIETQMGLIVEQYRAQLGSYLESLVGSAQPYVKIRIFPSSELQKTLKVLVLIMVNELEPVDQFRITSIASHMVEELAAAAQINAQEIELETVLTTGNSITESRDVLLGANPTAIRMEQDLVLTLALYLRAGLGRSADVRFVNLWSSGQPTGKIYLGLKDDPSMTQEPSPETTTQQQIYLEDAIKALRNVQRFTKGLNYIADKGLACTLNVVQNEEWSNFDRDLLKMLKTDSLVQAMVANSIGNCIQTMTHLMASYGLNPDLIEGRCSPTVVTTPTEAGYDLMYAMDYQGQLSTDDEADLEQEFEHLVNAGEELRHLLFCVSNAIHITPFLSLVDVTPEETDLNVPEVSPDAPSAFGL